MNSRPLVIAAATLGILATSAFALPNLPPNPVTDTVNDRVFKEKGKRFATVADVRAHTHAKGNPGFALPSWIPRDATDVRIHVRTTGKARLIRFTLGETPLDGPQCPAGTPKRVGGPGLNTRWWPADLRAEERPECRDAHQYQVAVRGKRVYAWTDGTPSPGRAVRDAVAG
ncbi:hypothetical protein ACWFQ8_30980 [Streptomyces sp. NPDC055254]